MTRLLIALTMLGAASATSAAAQTAPLPRAVRVLVEACDPPVPFLLQLPERLRIELSGLGLHVQPEDLGGDVAEVTLSVAGCAPEAEVVHVRVRAPSGGTASRDIALESDDAGRLLALAVAEMLRDEWPAVTAPAPAPTPPTAPSPAPAPPLDEAELRRIAREEVERAAPPPPTPRAHRWHLGGSVGMRLTPAYGAGTLRPAVFVESPMRGLLSVRVDLLGDFGGASDPLGDVDVFGVALGASLLLSRELDDLRLGIGPRIELGYGWLRGRPAEGAAVLGATHRNVLASLGARGELQLRVFGAVWLGISLEAGWMLAGLEGRAEDRRATGIAGPMLGAGLGLAAELGS